MEKDVLNLFSIVREMSVWVYYEIRYVRIQYIIDMIQGERAIVKKRGRNTNKEREGERKISAIAIVKITCTGVIMFK